MTNCFLCRLRRVACPRCKHQKLVDNSLQQFIRETATMHISLQDFSREEIAEMRADTREHVAAAHWREREILKRHREYAAAQQEESRAKQEQERLEREKQDEKLQRQQRERQAQEEEQERLRLERLEWEQQQEQARKDVIQKQQTRLRFMKAKSNSETNALLRALAPAARKPEPPLVPKPPAQAPTRRPRLARAPQTGRMEVMGGF